MTRRIDWDFWKNDLSRKVSGEVGEIRTFIDQ